MRVRLSRRHVVALSCVLVALAPALSVGHASAASQVSQIPASCSSDTSAYNGVTGSINVVGNGYLTINSIGVATITVQNNSSSCVDVGLAAYSRFSPDNGIVYHQLLNDADVVVDPGATAVVTLTATYFPQCAYQIDAFQGFAQALTGAQLDSGTHYGGNKIASAEVGQGMGSGGGSNTFGAAVTPPVEWVDGTGAVIGTWWNIPANVKNLAYCDGVPGVPQPTPELGSAELLATGLLPLGVALFVRRRARRRSTTQA